MKRWLLVILYGTALFYFSAQPQSGAGEMMSGLGRFFPHWSPGEMRQAVVLFRKTGHVLAYGLAALLVFYAVQHTPGLNRRPFLVAAVVSLFLAVADEWYQSTLRHRTGALEDVLLDAVGITAVLAGLFFSQSPRCVESHEP